MFLGCRMDMALLSIEILESVATDALTTDVSLLSRGGKCSIAVVLNLWYVNPQRIREV
jgi:hypothetical protein